LHGLSGNLQGEKPRRTGKPLPRCNSALGAPRYTEPTIKTGVKAMTAAVLELMPEEMTSALQKFGRKLLD